MLFRSSVRVGRFALGLRMGATFLLGGGGGRLDLPRGRLGSGAVWRQTTTSEQVTTGVGAGAAGGIGAGRMDKPGVGSMFMSTAGEDGAARLQGRERAQLVAHHH